MESQVAFVKTLPFQDVRCSFAPEGLSLLVMMFKSDLVRGRGGGLLTGLRAHWSLPLILLRIKLNRSKTMTTDREVDPGCVNINWDIPKR